MIFGRGNDPWPVWIGDFPSRQLLQRRECKHPPNMSLGSTSKGTGEKMKLTPTIIGSKVNCRVILTAGLFEAIIINEVALRAVKIYGFGVFSSAKRSEMHD